MDETIYKEQQLQQQYEEMERREIINAIGPDSNEEDLKKREEAKKKFERKKSKLIREKQAQLLPNESPFVIKKMREKSILGEDVTRWVRKIFERIITHDKFIETNELEHVHRLHDKIEQLTRENTTYSKHQE